VQRQPVLNLISKRLTKAMGLIKKGECFSILQLSHPTPIKFNNQTPGKINLVFLARSYIIAVTPISAEGCPQQSQTIYDLNLTDRALAD
jgi:hypothetical protein